MISGPVVVASLKELRRELRWATTRRKGNRNHRELRWRVLAPPLKPTVELVAAYVGNKYAFEKNGEANIIPMMQELASCWIHCALRVSNNVSPESGLTHASEDFRSQLEVFLERRSSTATIFHSEAYSVK